MKNYSGQFIAFLIVFSLSVNGQENAKSKPKIKIGMLGGINFSDIKSNSDQDKKTNMAPIVGLTAEFPIVHGLSAKIEPLYLNKGAKLMEGEDPMEEPEAHLKSSYIDLPVLLKYSFLEGISPYLITGVTIGYQLDTKLDVTFPGLETTIEMTEVTENFEFGISFGGGLEVPFNSMSLFFDCRYAFGITNMQKTGTVIADVGGVQVPVDYDKDENGYKNRGIQLLIGVTYSIE